MKLYKIKDWSKYYESGDARKIEGPLTWVPVRIKTDGFGYLRITQEKDRSDLLAAWYLMLGLAAKQPRSERGKLSRDGVPLSPDDMELLTRFPASIFSKALVFFSDAKQGWLVPEDIRINPDQSGVNPEQIGSMPPTGQDTILQDRTGEDKGAVPAGLGVHCIFPDCLKTQDFANAWADWLAYRRERKLAGYKPKTVEAQLSKLAEWGHDAAIESIRDSIRQQWQGLFEAKGGRKTGGGLEPRFRDAF